MKGEPAAEVAVVPGLREGQVVRLADHRWLFWWLKGAAFLFAFVFAATAARACLRSAGVAEAADKAAIVLGLAAGGLALWLAHRALRPKWRYAVVEILEVVRNAGTS